MQSAILVILVSLSPCCIAQGESYLPGSQILPVLERVGYDAETPPKPTPRSNSTMIVFSVYVRDVSKPVLDRKYIDSNVYLTMNWYDDRVRHPYQKTILIREPSIMHRFWRPDPDFGCAKDIKITNSRMLVKANGVISLKTKLQLSLPCQNDNKCSWTIRSFSYPKSMVRYQWLMNDEEAVSVGHEGMRMVKGYSHKYCKDMADGYEENSCLNIEMMINY